MTYRTNGLGGASAALAFLLLAVGCGPDSTGPAQNGSSSSSSSGAAASSSSGGSTGSSSSGGASSGGADGGGATGSDGGTDGAVADGTSSDGGKTDGAAFVCPTMPIPGTCAPPADTRCPYPKLSQTGCVDPANPLKMASVVIPYEVNSPLWSDGALKTRGMRLPTGQLIHVKDCAKNPTECCVVDPNTFVGCLPPADDGKWVFPVGTVMVKNFMFADVSQPSGMKFVETRLFIHVSDTTWVGYGYQWNDAQTEATITSDAIADVRTSAMFHVVPTAGAATTAITWKYPSRLDCMTCHQPIKPSGGFTLGLETAQLNRVAAGATANQIDQLAAMGLFDVPPSKPYKAALVAPYMGQTGAPPPTATLDERARSYLHANCSFCHRPDGTWNAMDVRFDVPLKSTGLCNAMPGKGNLGVAGALLLTPKSHANSVLWLRMMAPPGDATTGKTGRMPAIASDVIDTNATTLVGDWIDSIAACPM